MVHYGNNTAHQNIVPCRSEVSAKYHVKTFHLNWKHCSSKVFKLKIVIFIKIKLSPNIFSPETGLLQTEVVNTFRSQYSGRTAFIAYFHHPSAVPYLNYYHQGKTLHFTVAIQEAALKVERAFSLWIHKCPLFEHPGE